MKINLVVLPNHPPFIPSLGLERIKAKLASTNPKVEVRLLYLNIMMEKYFRPMNSLITVLFQHFLKNNSSKNLLDTLDEIMSVTLKSPHAPIRKFYEVRMKPLHDSLRHMIIKHDKRISALDRYCTVLINQTALMDCEIVGFTSVFTPLEPIIFFCRKLKTMNPSIKTVIGGSLVYKEIAREWIRKEPDVDYVVSGPALKSFPLLVSAIAEKNSKKSNSIPGVFTKINYNDITDRGEDIPLEDYPVLNYDAYVTAYNKYNRANKLRPRLLLEISRGCKWGRCNFCNHYAYDERYDYSDKGSELLQLKNILAKYPNADIQLSDAFVTPQWLSKLLDGIELKDNQQFLFHTKSNLKESTLSLLRAKGVGIFQPGIESLSEADLKLMNKGVSVFQNIKLLKLCLKYGLLPSWNYLIAIPGCTSEDIQRTLDNFPLFRHLYPPSGISPIYIVRWSRYYETPERFNLKLVRFPSITLYDDDSRFVENTCLYFYDVSDSEEKSSYQLTSIFAEKLLNEVDSWRQKWFPRLFLENLEKGCSAKDSDFKFWLNDLPKLYVFERSDKKWIHDSRNSEPREYTLSGLQSSLLSMLNNMNTFDRLVSKLDEKASKIRDALDWLVMKKFVFQEKNRYIGLTTLASTESYQKIWNTIIKNNGHIYI